MKSRSRFILSVLSFGYAFLYIPLISVVFYSFNASSLATVWAGSQPVGTASCFEMSRSSTPCF